MEREAGTKFRLIKNEPTEQPYEHLVTFENERDIMTKAAYIEFSMHVEHWSSIGSPELVDIEVTIPDRIGD